MDLLRVETELKKRLAFPYKWGRKQSDDWDAKTSFIYSTYTFEKLLEKTASFDETVRDYALNRWYNFWSAEAVENLFSLHEKVTPNINKFDKLIDFTINTTCFDHKTTVFPIGFNQTVAYAKNKPAELIQWLYLNQSQESRKHLKNRLFIVLVEKNKEHWKLKAEIKLLKSEIDRYVENFNSENLFQLNLENNTILSDLIWVEN
jgi:septum formation topological specificity factor MinE